MVIRFGTAPFPDGVVVARKEDRIFPVCAPSYAAQHDLSAFPDCAFELIEQDVPDRTWVRWADWFAQTGTHPVQARASLRFTYFTDTLAAALEGEGIAMGWEVLVRKELREGKLIRVGAHEITSTAAYNLVVAPGAKPSAQVELVKFWLAEELLC
jgi:DNA-binding transcriptional LysR family regulator